MTASPSATARSLSVAAVLAGVLSAGAGVAPASAQPAADAVPHRAVLDRYCVACHNERLRTAGLALDAADLAHVETDSPIWEQVIRKLRVGAMPPPGAAPTRPGRLAGPGGVSRDGARPGRRPRPRGGPHRDVPPPEPGRVPQRGARPARGRGRRLGPPAGRRRRRARLRQHGGGAVGLAGPPGTLPVGGAQDQPARGGTGAAGAERRDPPHPPAAVPGRPAQRGSPVRLARGHRGAAPVPRGRRVLRQAALAAHLYRLHPRARHPPAPRRAGRRAARHAVHGRRRCARPRHRRPGQLRREHPPLRPSRLGDLRARGRRGPRDALPRRGGRAGGRRVVRAQALGDRRRPPAPPDRLPPRHQRALAGERGRRQRGDRRAVRGGRPGRHREPPRRLHVSSRPGGTRPRRARERSWGGWPAAPTGVP